MLLSGFGVCSPVRPCDPVGVEWSDDGLAEVNTVRTTGIYCRAGCAARPDPSNCARMSSAVAAEVAGYRACLRCRPDHLPIVPIRPDSDRLVSAALLRIGSGALDRDDDGALGRELGVSARHLRRLFVETLGVTPAQVARSRRAHFARLLLDDTDLSVTEIAFASGFGSVRTLNEVVLATFRSTPTDLRRRRRRRPSSVDGGLQLRLHTPSVADAARVVESLGATAVPGVEAVDDGIYRRTTEVCGHPGVIEVSTHDDRHLNVTVHLPTLAGLIDEVARVRRVFRLDHTTPGEPGPWSPWEGSVRDAIDDVDVLRRLTERYGAPVEGASHLGLTHTFPDALALRAVIDGGGAADVVPAIRRLLEQVPAS